MTQYDILNVKLSYSQLNKIKSVIKSGTKVTLDLPSNMVDKSIDETIFSHKLLLTNKQVSRIYKAFGNVSSANINFS